MRARDILGLPGPRSRSKLRSFHWQKGRGMQHDHKYDSFQDFLSRTDSGELDGQFTTELKKLSREQLEQLAHVLAERDDEKRARRG